MHDFFQGVAMPLHTILIVSGSWILLLVLLVWKYKTWQDKEEDN
jgi:hypothetical protein